MESLTRGRLHKLSAQEASVFFVATAVQHVAIELEFRKDACVNFQTPCSFCQEIDWPY